MMTRLFTILTVALLCALSSCIDEGYVAKCGHFALTVDDLRYEVVQLGPSYRFDGSYEARMKLVENLTARYILAEEAARMGFGEDVGDAEAEGEALAVGQAYSAWKLEKSIRVPRISSLKWREKLARNILIQDIAFRARGTAEDAAFAIREGAAYEDIRAAFSENEGVAFNEIGWKVWREMDRSLTKHVFPLEVGQFSEIVTLPDGYHLFYLADAERLGMKEEVLFLRARKFDRWVKEEKAKRQSQRELIARYRFRPDPDGVEAAMEAFMAAFAGDRAPEELMEKPVAAFEGGEVTVAELFTLYFNSPPEARFYAGDPYGIIKAAWEVAVPRLYVQAGYDMRLDALYDVKWSVSKVRKDYLVPQMEDHFRAQIDVTDADIEEYYENRKDDLVVPISYRASRILLETRDEVATVTAELRAGGDFASLAEKYSHDSYTGAKGGDMGVINHGIVSVYDSVVAGLEPGETSEPFITRSGFEILKLAEMSGGQQLSFEEAIPYVEMFIRNQTANDMLADMVREKKEEWGFFVNEDLLASVWLPEPGWKESQAQPSAD